MNSARPTLAELETALADLRLRGRQEARQATQDGFLWPYARGEMRHPRRIRERLAEDAGRMIAGGATLLMREDFLRLGWRREQLETYCAAALQTLNRENACGNDPIKEPT